MNNLFINSKFLNTTLSFMLAGTITTSGGSAFKSVDNFIEPKEEAHLTEQLLDCNNDIVTSFFPSMEKDNTILLSDLTEEEKVDYICSMYNLTKEQYNVIKGIVLAEAKYDSLEDAAAVCSAILNRANSKSWGGNGHNLYEQATRSGQFVVYASGAYRMFMNICEGEAYRGFQTVLLRGIPYTYYLNFCSDGPNELVSGGNNFYGTFNIDNYIEDASIEQEEYFNDNKDDYFDLSNIAITYEPVVTSCKVLIMK